MPARRILLVDDQRDVTRMLRASLQTLGRGYVIVDVPSGEEALLEIGRGTVDLLITDIRLPGMSGLQLMERVRRSNAQARAILITGNPTPDLQAQAARLNACAFFAKPIRTGEFLHAVQAALGDAAPEPQAEAVPEPQSDSPGISDRLAMLRRDLGALAVFLVDLDGRVVVRAGDLAALKLESLMPHLMSGFTAALKVTAVLGGLVPSNIQFFDGDEFDIFTANVGVYFGLVMVLEGERGMAQMGPVLRYGRQAVDDVLHILAAMGVPHAPEAPPPPPAVPEAPEAEFEPVLDPHLEDAAQRLATQDVDAFWRVDTAAGAADETRPDGLTYEQAVKLGLLPGELPD